MFLITVFSNVICLFCNEYLLKALYKKCIIIIYLWFEFIFYRIIPLLNQTCNRTSYFSVDPLICIKMSFLVQWSKLIWPLKNRDFPQCITGEMVFENNQNYVLQKYFCIHLVFYIIMKLLMHKLHSGYLVNRIQRLSGSEKQNIINGNVSLFKEFTLYFLLNLNEKANIKLKIYRKLLECSYSFLFSLLMKCLLKKWVTTFDDSSSHMQRKWQVWT